MESTVAGSNLRLSIRAGGLFAEVSLRWTNLLGLNFLAHEMEKSGNDFACCLPDGFLEAAIESCKKETKWAHLEKK